MSKKKKSLLTVLSVAGILATLGLSVGTSLVPQNVSEATASKYSMTAKRTNNTVLNANLVKQESKFHRSFTPEEINAGEADLGGLHYKLDEKGNVTMVGAVAHPETVKEVIFFARLGGKSCNYDSVDLSGYTAVEDVVAVYAYIPSKVWPKIHALKTAKNLYIAGGTSFGDELANSSIENLYCCNYGYRSTDSFYHDTLTTKLGASSIKKIYYNDLYETHFKDKVTEFNTASHKNKLSETVVAEKMTTCKYPQEIFFIDEGYAKVKPTYGTKGYFEDVNSGAMVYASNLIWHMTEVDSRLSNLDLTTMNDRLSDNIIRTYNYGKVVVNSMHGNKYTGLKAEELIIKKLTDRLDLSQLDEVKAIRFVNSQSARLELVGSLPAGSKLQHIYIPSEYKTVFQTIIDNPDLSSKITYFDEINYVIPTYSYKSPDGCEYEVDNEEYSIDELEAAKEVVKSMGVKFLPEMGRMVIDQIINSYEVPIHDYAGVADELSFRKFDTIVLPKTMKLKNVINAFKETMVLNHGYPEDATGISISYDEAAIKQGENTSIELTISKTGMKSEIKTVAISFIDTLDKVAYVMDGNDVYILKNKTAEKEHVDRLLMPLMEKHIGESAFTVTESMALDTTKETYIAANSYKATGRNGKARVLVTNVALTENGGTDVVEPSKPTPDPTGVYTVNTINRIYIDPALDGMRVQSQLYDLVSTKDGKPFYQAFNTSCKEVVDNKKDYVFSMFTTFPNGYEARMQVPVSIIKTDIKISFVVFDNGNIAVLYNHFENYKDEQIHAALRAFMTAQNLNVESLVLPTFNQETQKTVGSYDKGEIHQIRSGVNLSFTSPTNPTDQTEAMKGYAALEDIYYTDNFTVDQVLRAFGKRVLLKDGKRVTNFNVEYTSVANNPNLYSYKFTDDSGTILLEGRVKLEKVKSEYQYMFGRALDFDSGVLLMNVVKDAPNYTANAVLAEALSNFRNLLQPFNNPKDVDFTKTGNNVFMGTYQYGNGAYYKYSYDFEIIDINKEVDDNQVIIDGQGPKTASDKVKDWFASLGDKIKNNKAYQATTIVLGTITGALLIWGLVVIFRKLHRWLKRR